jgi:hypothetical protein
MRYHIRLHGFLIVDAPDEETARAEAFQAIAESPDLLDVRPEPPAGARAETSYDALWLEAPSAGERQET